MAKGRKTKKKDIDAPKRHIAAYMLYNLERIEKLKQEKPELNWEERAEIIMNEWNNLSDAKKKPYIEKAEADKKKYEAKKKAFDAKKKV